MTDRARIFNGTYQQKIARVTLVANKVLMGFEQEGIARLQLDISQLSL